MQRISWYVLLFLVVFGGTQAGLALPISYALPADAYVSLAVYDMNGRMVRELLRGNWQPKGGHVVEWDGLDTAGKATPAGKYQWKLLHHPGLQAEYLMSLGVSTRHAPWPGSHGGPEAVAVDRDGFVMGSMQEGPPIAARSTFTGDVLWQARGGMGYGQGYSFPSGESDPVSMAIDGERLYMLTGNGALYAMNAHTGAVLRDAKNNVLRHHLWATVFRSEPITAITDRDDAKTRQPARRLTLAAPNGSYITRVKARLSPEASPDAALIVTVNGQTFNFRQAGLRAGGVREILLPWLWDSPTAGLRVTDGKLTVTVSYTDSAERGAWSLDEVALLSPARNIDARDGALAAVYPQAKHVAWIDPQTGAPQATAEVNDARDVALIDGDTLIVATKTGLQRVRKAALHAETVAAGLSDVTRVSWDPASRTLFAFCRGERQQVVALDDTFTPRATFGRAGGRRTGLYVAEDFLDLTDLAADGQGGFFITENSSAPRRTAWFDAQGKVRREWYGGQQYYCYASMDPQRPNRIWMESQWGWVMEMEVDWAKRSWVPRATYRWNAEFDGRLLNKGLMTRGLHVTYRDVTGDGRDKTFLWSDGHHGLVLTPDETAGVLRPVAAIGNAQLTHPIPSDLHAFPACWLDALRLKGLDAAKHEVRTMYTWFSWADTNADGKFDSEELRLRYNPEGGKYISHGAGIGGLPGLCSFMDKDWTIYLASNTGQYTVIPKDGVTPTGAPIWDITKAQPGVAKSNTGLTMGVLPDTQGNIYQILHGGGDGYSTGDVSTWGGHGPWWPATKTDGTALVKWDAKGHKLWQVGPHAARKSQRGELQYPVRIAGLVQGCVGVSDMTYEPMQFWSTDGLYVGRFNDRRMNDGLPDHVYNWENGYQQGSPFNADMASGGSVTQLPTGEVIFMGAGANNVPVFRVHGWADLQRQQGTIAVTPTTRITAATGTGTGLAVSYYANAALTGAPLAAPAPPAAPDADKEAIAIPEEIAADRIDARLWFGGARKWPAGIDTARPFSAQWNGFLEPRYSEEYTFAIYTRGGVRCWLDGKVILDKWDTPEGKHFTLPVALQAGRRYPIRMEWRALGASPELHLCWHSRSQQIEHIPTAYLYPQHEPLPLAR